MSGNVFREIAASVPAETLARTRGLKFRGKRAFCPFHNDGRHPAMSFSNGLFHCFVCHAGGDSVKLAELLDKITPLEAARRVNAEFQLGFDLDAPEPRNGWRQQCRRERQRRREQTTAADTLTWAQRVINTQRPVNWNEMSSELTVALKHSAEIEWYMDAILSGDENWLELPDARSVVRNIDAIRAITAGRYTKHL